MCHHDSGASPPQRADGAVNGPLRARVQGRGGLVQQQDLGVPVEHNSIDLLNLPSTYGVWSFLE